MCLSYRTNTGAAEGREGGLDHAMQSCQAVLTYCRTRRIETFISVLGGNSRFMLYTVFEGTTITPLEQT